jgi:hypothetical protein
VCYPFWRECLDFVRDISSRTTKFKIIFFSAFDLLLLFVSVVVVAPRPSSLCSPGIRKERHVSIMTSSPDDFNMAMAVLDYLQESKLVSAAAALKDELQSKFGKKKLSGYVSKGTITFVPGTAKKPSAADDSSSSDDSSSDSEEDTKAKKKAPEAVKASKDDDSSDSDSSSSDDSSDEEKAAKAVIAKKGAVAASKKASSSDDSSSSSSDDDSDDDEAKKKAVVATKKAAVTKAAAKESDSSDSDSSSSSESEEEKKTAPVIASKKTKTAKAAPKKAAAKDDSDSDDDKEMRRPTKKRKTEATAEAGIITPEVEDSDDDSEVSDVDVSDVSSVDVSSSDSDSDSSSESESEDEDVAKERLLKKKTAAALKAKEAAKAASEWRPAKKPSAKTVLQTTPGSDGAQASNQGVPFQRVDSDFWGEEAQKSGGAMADNSYENAFGGDGFGLKASEKLLTVRGKDFRHEKTKRKRSFNGFARGGGQINVEKTYSTKYTYSDDEK